VNSAQTVRSLLLRGLVERTEDSSDKRKFRYKATTDALAHLGVAKVADLPRYAELKKEADAAIALSAEADV
jgi:chromosome segregation and condensation protein ScpB